MLQNAISVIPNAKIQRFSFTLWKLRLFNLKKISRDVDDKVASVTPLQRYSDFCDPPICEKLLLYLYIYINIKSILGGGIGRNFTVTL